MKHAILICSQRLAFCQLLMDYLKRTERFPRVYHTTTSRQALEMVRTGRGDVVLLDPDHSSENMFQLARRISRIQERDCVLFMADSISEGWISRALEVHAAGFLGKSDSLSDYGRAIRSVLEGYCYFTPGAARVLSEVAGRTTRVPLLTDREREVLQMVCEGFVAKEIARKLELETKTVEEIRLNLMRKTRTTKATGLVRYACQERLVDLKPRWERRTAAGKAKALTDPKTSLTKVRDEARKAYAEGSRKRPRPATRRWSGRGKSGAGIQKDEGNPLSPPRGAHPSDARHDQALVNPLKRRAQRPAVNARTGGGSQGESP